MRLRHFGYYLAILFLFIFCLSVCRVVFLSRVFRVLYSFLILVASPKLPEILRGQFFGRCDCGVIESCRGARLVQPFCFMAGSFHLFSHSRYPIERQENVINSFPDFSSSPNFSASIFAFLNFLNVLFNFFICM